MAKTYTLGFFFCLKNFEQLLSKYKNRCYFPISSKLKEKKFGFSTFWDSLVIKIGIYMGFLNIYISRPRFLILHTICIFFNVDLCNYLKLNKPFYCIMGTLYNTMVYCISVVLQIDIIKC